MSDYWKSLPRKFCDTCKCWFADNKASIEFHEKGKKHKENVQKRITEIQKKGLKELKKKKKLENEMEKIERAAFKAFKNDVAANPELADQYKKVAANEPMPQFMPSVQIKPQTKSSNKTTKVSQSAKKSSSETTITKIWYEGISDEGDKYYWNSVTSESQWDPPPDGYISIEEQNNASTDSTSLDATETPEDTTDIPSDAFGPAPKQSPYGKWIAVDFEPVRQVDFQLPVGSDEVEAYIPMTKEDTIKIKEKTVGHLADYDGGACTFKKRKNLSNAKRNVRQRFEDT